MTSDAKKLRVLVTCSVLLISICMLLLENIWPSIHSFPITQITALPAIAYYVWLHYKNNPRFVLSGFYQIYAFSGLLLSALTISFGTYMLEVDKAGTANGAFWVAVTFLILGNEIALLGFKIGNNKGSIREKRIMPQRLGRWLAITLLLVTLLTAVLIMLFFKGPVLTGLDRVTFWRSVPPPLNNFPSLLGQSFFIAAYLYQSSKYESKRAWIFALVVLMYIFFTVVVSGEKFSAFMIYIFGWMVIKAGFARDFRVQFNDYVRWVVIGTLIVMLLVYSYAASEKEAVFIFSRIALQAQLLWSVLNEDVMRLLLGGDWGCYLGCRDFGSGVELISARYVPPVLWDFYSEAGSGLTGFMPSLPILLYGFPVALILHLAASLLLGFIQAKAVAAVRSRDVVYAFLVFKIYLGITIFWYAAKEVVLPGIAVTIILLIGLKILIKKKFV